MTLMCILPSDFAKSKPLSCVLHVYYRKKEIKAKRKAKQTDEDVAVKRQKSDECGMPD